jgi:hypothetical protein
MSKFVLGTGEAYPLKDGVVLVNKRHPASTDDEAWDIESDGRKIGYITVYFYSKEGPSIGDIQLYDKRGLGIGRAAILTLLKKYGKIGSDPQGATSDDAHRMWASLGATEAPTNKNTKGWRWELQS